MSGADNDGVGRTASYAEATDVAAADAKAEENDVPVEERDDTASDERIKAGASDTDTKGDAGANGKEGVAKHGTQATPPDGPPQKPPFRFFHLLHTVHKRVVTLPGYALFMLKFFILQAVRIGSALSFVVVAYIIADDFDIDDISDEQYVAFGAIGVLYVLGSLVPHALGLQIDELKESLQCAQATAVVEKIFDMQYDEMVTTPTGEFVQLISKVFRNLDTLLPALYGAIIPVFVEVAIAVVLIGVLFGPICLIQLGLFFVYTVASYRIASHKSKRNSQMMTVMFSEWGKIMATATSYERAQIFGNVDYEVAACRSSFDKIGERMLALVRGEHYEGMALSFISLAVTVGIILLLPLADVSGLELAALALYYLIFFANLSTYATAVSNLRAAVGEYQVFDEYCGRKSEIADVPGAIELSLNKNPTIEFSNVSFSYGGKDILDNVSFRVEGGQTVGLVGSSGCGKSTIFRLLLRFYRPTSGTITIDGHDVSQVTGKSLRRLFSVMPQDAQLYNDTIRANIAYGKMGASDEELLEAARLAELPLSKSGGENDLTLDKACGEKGAKLSGGQQQRVALARAMLKPGTIFLLDEPTTALDGVVALQLQQTLDKLSTNATTLYITHHLEDLHNADQILYLDSGRIVESGTFESLMAEKGRLFTQVGARRQSSGVVAAAGLASE